MTIAAKSGKNWSYNPDTNTLRLYGSIEGSAEFDHGGGFDCGIYCDIPDLTIEVLTDSIVRGSGTKPYSYGIRAAGHDLTITGDGKLIAQGGSGNDPSGAYGYTYGIMADQITVNDSLDARGGRSQHEFASYGVETGEIKGDGELAAAGYDSGINAVSAGVTINGVTVTAEGGKYGIYLGSSVDSSSKITIKDGSRVVASGTVAGISGKVKNEIAGTGWTDIEGTQGQKTIPVHDEEDFIDAYKKVQFPKDKEPAVVTTAPTAKKLTYNGSAQALVTAGRAKGGTMQYALGTDADTAPKEGWSTSIPTAVKAGTYYVWYKAIGDDDHNDSDDFCVTVKISSRTPYFPPVHTCSASTLTRVPAKDASCTEDGNIEYFKCVCGKYYADRGYAPEEERN